MTRRKKNFPEADELDQHPLANDLAETLKRVGPHNYGKATARKFAPGGPYAPRAPRRRTAIT